MARDTIDYLEYMQNVILMILTVGEDMHGEKDL